MAVSSRPTSAPLRDPLPRTLLALTFVTGIVDAVGFLALGQVFAAMMTGNVLFFGFGIAGASGASVVGPLVGVAAFMAGGVTGSLLDSESGEGESRGLIAAIGFEVALVAAAAVVALLVEVRADEGSAYAVLAMLALAMGARSTVVRRRSLAELPTNVVTLTLANLATAASPVTASGDHLVLRSSAVGAMLAGAIAGALLLKGSIELALAAAAALSLAALVAYALSRRS